MYFNSKNFNIFIVNKIGMIMYFIKLIYYTPADINMQVFYVSAQDFCQKFIVLIFNHVTFNLYVSTVSDRWYPSQLLPEAP